MNRLPPALLGAALLALAALPAGAQDAATAAPPADLHIVYLSRDNDAAYQPVRAENGVTVPTLPDPSPGAELALRDTRATARALGIAVVLDRRVLPESAPVADAVAEIANSNAVAVIADVPKDDLVALARAAPKTLAVFDVRQHDDDLRAGFCDTPLFHLLPSDAMATDALAQFLVQKNWRRAFVLHGPLPADRRLAAAFATSARKFGAKVVATKQFAIGNDPRRRDEIDVSLMTSSDDYDVVFLADTGRDFGRFVPWQLSRPRPVVGTEGLEASAWDPLAERFGAPQVNHRFARLAKRDMNSGDWATWAAVRSVVEAAIRRGARDAASVEKSLAEDQVPIDVSKGIESSFRPWDHQFRQAVMLHSADAVIAYAPFEQFLHRRTPLDTLGVDLEEIAVPAEVTALAGADSAPAVSVAALSKSYGGVKALDEVSFVVPTGSVTALLGLNGAGKTTLFQILTGLFVADSGRVAVFGDDIATAPVRALGQMGIVFQQPVLDLDLTVHQNLAFHAGLHGLGRRRAAGAIADGLARFRIGDLAAKRVRDLSGGTRRKVELVRALLTAPRLLLLDEPSQGLDTRSRADLVADVFALAAERGTTVLWATHLVAEVERADRIVVLHRGRVAADDSPGRLTAACGAPTLEAAFLAIARSDAAA